MRKGRRFKRKWCKTKQGIVYYIIKDNVTRCSVRSHTKKKAEEALFSMISNQEFLKMDKELSKLY